ncbi:acetate kinase [Dechloromonas denitrificans]|uniref:acetate kinase n=1 Tax=Dechloromonas denitrificans TaxID=281362 RepID=UPI001CFB4374|nr:acetate kinase [Dechloromonas denitrificans]UCV08992.1 acetate kinase [Dechloromonas denitrificans]
MLCSGLAQGADLSFEQEKELRSQINEQTKRLEALRQQMVEADAKLAEIRKVLGIETLRSTRGGTGNSATIKDPQSFELAQAPSSTQTEALRREPTQPAESRPQQVAQIFEQPGVLTPRGKFVLEPGLQYSYSSSSRVSIVGYTIIPALTIGLIDVREVKRNTFTGSLTGRWGITNRFEIEAKLPYVYRSDDVLARPINSGSGRDELFSSTGNGIGDVEVTGRYQFNDGGIDKPYYIGTLRFKSRTGKDPFEVLTDTSSSPNVISNEIQKELPTGSGFYTLQPGLTMLYPTDPAVFFGSLNYQYNFKRSGVTMNTTQGPVSLGDIEPGPVIGFNFGMGLALNERSSFSIGYDHASVGQTKINGVKALNSVRTQLGTLLLGYSQRLDSTRSLNVSVGAGVTRDTPDITLSVRLPMSF